MKSTEPFTIILPVYGRAELLEPALDSVLKLKQDNWQLLIADDGSDDETKAFIHDWIKKHKTRTRWIQREINLGLFANLNKAIQEADTEWVLLLCSDDQLLPGALSTLKDLRELWPEAGLHLSTHASINANGSPRPSESASYHDQLSPNTALISPEVFVPSLLRLGSLNGNLTGMAFSRSRWQEAGPFREDWRHAADWEWLVRASQHHAIVLNRVPIAEVRTHDSQLSNSNRRTGHELREVAAVVQALRLHPLLAHEPRRQRWAAHMMQFQLWNSLKASARGEGHLGRGVLLAIHKAAGVRQTVWALIRWLPTRWQLHRKSSGH